MSWLIFFVAYLILGIICPLRILSKKFFKSDNKEVINKPKIFLLKKSFIIFLYSIVFIIIIALAMNYYLMSIPSSTSELCTNSGGWVYSCLGDEKIAGISLLIMFIVTIVYYKLCEKVIYDIFRNVKSKLKYITIVLYLIFMFCFNLLLIFILSGVFISTYYNSQLLEIFRIIVGFLPMSVFALSTYLNLLIKK